MRRKKNKSFFQPPDDTDEFGILNSGANTYGRLSNAKGKQPYYWYQGIGNITGVPIIHVCNVTFENIQVTFNGEKVTFKCD